MKTSSILVIYTGGTIGMKRDPVDGTLKPFDFSQIAGEVQELSKSSVRITPKTFDPLIDSSNVEPSMWVELANLISDSHDSYDGFVVLHGTDTMAYSASALSFMLEGLDKPVVFTGSQLPIGVPRTDGRENLVSAIEIAAAKDASGQSLVPEVCIYFNSRLLRGNRSTKFSAEAFDAFISPNCPALADAGITIRYNRDVIRRAPGGGLNVHTNLDTRVAILKLHPGMTPEVMRSVVCSPATRACIIETYGSGNALSKDWFIDIVKEASAQGKILLNVTQCISGTVNMDLYATGTALKNAGVVTGKDITTEAALGKLFCLMGMSGDNSWVKAKLEENLAGEISE